MAHTPALLARVAGLQWRVHERGHRGHSQQVITVALRVRQGRAEGNARPR